MDGGRQSKVKRAARRSREIEFELAKLYKKFPCLWMTDSPTYEDLEGRYAAYSRIVEALRPRFGNLSLPTVVYKIRDLRYRYCVELTKIERAAVSGVNYTPNVPWFPVMRSFLDLRFRTEEIEDPPQSSDELFSSNDGDDEAQMKIPNDYNDYDGTRLTPSMCRTIYDNRLKIGDSKSTVGESEELGNDREVEAGAPVAAVENRVEVCIGDRAWGEISKIKYHSANEFTGRGSSPLGESPSESAAGFGKKSSDAPSVIPVVDDHRDHRKTLLRNEVTLRPAGTEFDEFEAFGTSVGSQLKRLEPSLVAKLEVKILLILNEERSRCARL
ncbi:uncharacterized protein LOC105683212 [Athalia rosae]|uniref:uncharacterized protein LOC105683212 n=1 Tax=Athalia rosae TaxID=37344 RepID=UPI002034847D|nr:uncharacterized protein LOC105683212 [Athalia rosae]